MGHEPFTELHEVIQNMKYSMGGLTKLVLMTTEYCSEFVPCSIKSFLAWILGQVQDPCSLLQLDWVQQQEERERVAIHNHKTW